MIFRPPPSQDRSAPRAISAILDPPRAASPVVIAAPDVKLPEAPVAIATNGTVKSVKVLNRVEVIFSLGK